MKKTEGKGKEFKRGRGQEEQGIEQAEVCGGTHVWSTERAPWNEKNAVCGPVEEQFGIPDKCNGLQHEKSGPETEQGV